MVFWVSMFPAPRGWLLFPYSLGILASDPWVGWVFPCSNASNMNNILTRPDKVSSLRTPCFFYSSDLNKRLSNCMGRGRGRGNLGLIMVRVCESVFKNLPHSYFWPLKKNNKKKKNVPFIYLIVRNVDLFIYCPLIFIPIYCW